ncbi:MAG: outer membrane protein [Solimicrobium sp.]|jgi:NodT family efflux transporter outer membrane factor (OMF) lipoprotein|nr:outer membrane protein [Solimicrobium sp.]
MHLKQTKLIRSLTLAITYSTIAALLSACTIGPDYVRPTAIADADLPTSFKENWKTAQPLDQHIPSKWWTIFNDDNLSQLIEQVANSNLTLAQAEANYRQAYALADSATTAYYPSLKGSVAITRSHTPTNHSTGTNSFGITANWEPDLWGKIRRTVEMEKNTALASFAHAQATLLSMQSQLAQNYFQLRVLDAQKELLGRTVEDFRRSLTLTQHQYKAGLVASDNVLLAETQLRSTEAQALDVGIQRAQLEHAIALLIGKPPGSFSIPAIPISNKTYMPNIPQIPVALPSTLLERRPDIAAAERTVAAANAQVGLAKAAYFPDLTLSASGSYQSGTFAHWLTLPNRIWAVGPALAATLFDAGAKRMLTTKAVAAYDASVASYRQTVLTAFQNVEDNLVALRILHDEAEMQNLAVLAARKGLDVTLNRYQAGAVNYLNVVTAQTAVLSNERTSLSITNMRLIATVKLIAALGGGWEGEDLCTIRDERTKIMAHGRQHSDGKTAG